MATNPYFSRGNTIAASEQKLLDDLTVEFIQINGVDLMYMPRTLVTPDELFGEDAASKWKKAFEIEMYLEDPYDYTGDEIIGMFGHEVRKELTFQVSRTRFTSVTGMNQPRQGDWIMHPIAKIVLEITFVEDETEFYQLGKQFTYKIKTAVAEYSHEKIETGFESIDIIAKEFFNDGTDSNGLANDRGAQNDVIKEVGEEATDFSEESPFGRQ